ncbi:hypothetical protein BDV12DRAFT_169348 [Aspergillus spectabilis]
MRHQLTNLSNLLSTLEEGRCGIVLARIVDITDRAAIKAFLLEAKDKFGKIDGCANIAGTTGCMLGHEEIWQVDESQYDHVTEINARGVFNVLGEALWAGVSGRAG